MLEELGAGDKPLVTALNKIDLLSADDGLGEEYPSPVPISARTGEGIPELLAAVDGKLQETMTPLRLLLPYSKGDLVSLIYEHGRVEREEFTENGTLIEGRLPAHLASRVQDWSLAQVDGGQGESA
jgi:GTP-binding protein HflX